MNQIFSIYEKQQGSKGAMMTPKQVSEIANEVKFHIQTACGEVAFEMTESGSGYDDKWKKRIAKARKNGVMDIRGWLADELYNDPDIISDLVGDKLSDLVSEKQIDYNLVLDELDKNAFDGMRKAIRLLRK